MPGKRPIDKAVLSYGALLFPMASMMVIFMFVIGLSYYNQWSWMKHVNSTHPLTEDINLAITQLFAGHLWFEEILAGDTSIDPDEVGKNFDKAKSAATHAIADDNNVYMQTPLNGKLEKALKRLIADINILKKLAAERQSDMAKGAAGSELDQRFDMVFRKAIIEGAAAITMVERLRIESLVQREKIFYSILGLIFLIILIYLSTYLFWEKARKKSVLALLESENRLRSLSEAAFEGVVIHDKGKIIQCNALFASMFGYEPDEIIGKTVLDLTAPDHRDMARDKIAAGYDKRYELKGIRKDGSVIDLEIRGVRGSYDGRPVRVVAVNDITERKKAENELRKSREDLDKAQSVGHTGSFYWNINAKKATWSNEMCRIFGVDPATFTPTYQEFIGMVHPEDREIVNMVTANAMRGNGFDEIDFRIIRPDRSERFLSFRGEVRQEPNGELRTMIGVVQDITERKKIESALFDAKGKAEKATREKDKYLSLIAHDLKAPFTLIMGFIKLMMSDKKTVLPDSYTQRFEAMLETSERTVDLIDDVLRINRFHSGKIKINRKFINGGKEAFAVTANFGHLARSKGIELTNNVPDGYRIYADPNLFGEVLQNLVHNSIKFTSIGGSVSVFAESGKTCVIGVKDTGSGISEDVADDVFRHEVRTTRIGTAGERGTGLGLPLCREIIEAHDGELTFESVEGGGTVFYIRLPHKNPVVLMIDDDKETRFVVDELMAEIDIDVIHEDSAKTALETAKKSRPHLIITGLNLPAYDGLELLNQLKREREIADIPVIIIMSDEKTEIIEKALRLGADDYVAKPVKKEDFVPRVRKYIV